MGSLQATGGEQPASAPPLFYQPAIDGGVHHLDPEESRHCVRVLRKRVGDVIAITDGLGFFYEALITGADAGRCLFEVTGKRAAPARDYYVHLAISPTKNADRIEWFVEKVTEIGVDRITLMACMHTERAFINTGRLKKVAVSAMKQSRKALLPAISEGVVSFDAVVGESRERERCIAFVDSGNPLHLRDAITPRSTYCVLIGPEGDFSPEELALAEQHAFRKVSLGSSRLRTETAGMVACHVLNLINQT